MNHLTGISSLTTYQFRLADHYASIRNYIGKVTFTTSPSRKYSFVYIPYGQSASMVMLDYLLANRKSFAADLQDSLQDMIRNDTSMASPMELVVVSDRSPLKESLLQDETLDADRIIKQPLQVIRRVHLSDRIKTAGMAQLDPTQMSVRVNKDELHIDLPPASASRSISTEAAVGKEKPSATRTERFAGKKINEWFTGERTSTFDVFINTERSLAERKFWASLFVQMEREYATRSITHNLSIENSLPLSSRDNRHAMFTDWSRSIGERHFAFEMTRHLVQAFHRRKTQPTKVLRDMDWAYLKARQYDALLHFLQRASRIATQDLAIHRASTGFRSIRQDGSLLQTHDWGYRDFTRLLSLDSFSPTAFRPYQNDLFINHSRLHATRPYQSLGTLMTEYAIGNRDVVSDLAIFLSQITGTRTIQTDASLMTYLEQSSRHNCHPLFVPNPINDSLREKTNPLWIPQHFELGKKDLSRSTSIIRDDVRANRQLLHAAHLWEKERPINLSGGKAPKPSFYQNEDDIFANLENVRPSLLQEWLAAQLYSREATMDGLLAEEMIFAAMLRLLPAHLLEDILASKEFPSHLMDDMIFASRLTDGQSILEALMEWALTNKTFDAYVDEEFLEGVRTRVQALIESEVIFSKALQDRAGILSFETWESTRPNEVLSHLEEDGVAGKREVLLSSTVDEAEITSQMEAAPATIAEALVGEDVFRPAELQIEHPFSYMEPDPSFLFDEHTARKSAHASDLDELPVTALLRSRITELCSGYLFATSPHERASYLLDLYDVAEKSARDGELQDDEWRKYAKLALEQTVLHEQLIAYQPEAAAHLIESILSYKQLDQAVINTDWIANNQERATSLLTQIMGKKELADAVILEYLAGQLDHRKGHIEQPLLSVRDYKKAWADRIEEIGQGLVYDYSDDVLEAEHDPEHWSGGFSVPEVYDPHDPFNAYYPWTTDMNALAMGQDNWTRFGSGTWEHNRDQGTFTHPKGSSGMSGFIRNDFTYTDYQFEVDFKVDEPADGDSAGIVFKYHNAQNYWMFVVSDGSASGMPRPMQLFKVENGRSIMYSTPMNPFAWEKEKWYTLRVWVTGNRIRVWVDHNLQYDFTD
ncbi:family 16 glycoside hydrolase [Brevibacillus sp. MS2.2]|uniref:family 16 glycoside hydrolase n=1 Tax=Brevibacillus sp. MS2.2 TaxID=2738981 RepID=UPI002811C023|nr:family 16 glycoside hydrolase [Brevibacillus sp. MS2.2]